MTDTGAARQQAENWIDAGHLRAAADLLRKFVALNPDDFGAWCLLAETRLLQGRGKEALAAASVASRLDPRSERSLVLLAEAQLMAKEPARAAQTAQLMIDMHRVSARALDIQGRAMLQTHRYPEAESIFRKAIAISSTDWWLWNDLGVAFLGQNRDVEAIDAFARSVQANPEIAGLRDNLFTASAAFVGAGGLLLWGVVIERVPDFASHLGSLPAYSMLYSSAAS